jgi:aryl-alcohol dehydrogenase-like predicted oxidoreductase/enamine deaminase RidA (YjgF/YER057c/UK114 family)
MAVSGLHPGIDPAMTIRDGRAAPMPRTALGGLDIGQLVTGLWQVADIERTQKIDLDAAADELQAYVADGFDTFDMADHYGSAEDICGRLRTRGVAARMFTKWCPTPGPMTREVVRAGIGRSLDRLRTDRIDLLQLHWWSFGHPAYLDAMAELARLQEEGAISELGVTNFDTDHLRVLLGQGYRIASNQVSFSLLDRRAAEQMTALCLNHGVRLLAYGTLAGGFFDPRWLDAPEPDASQIADWSRSKYRRFINAAGGWAAFQAVLGAVAGIAARHGVSMANVATRWVLDQPAVAAVIVGARLGERQHRADNAHVFGFSLDAADHALLDQALAGTTRIPGDCGDEYRVPPYLTASGDLSHHLSSLPHAFVARDLGRGRTVVDTGTEWERLAGYSRALRIGQRVLVSGTTATDPHGRVVCPGDPHGQTVYVLDKIAASLTALGAGLADVVRTRVYLRDVSQWEPVARVHGKAFAEARPANTLVQAGLVGEYEVEIDAEAWVE